MKVNSTGLGKTTLVANFGVLEPIAGAPPALKMTIESTQPIHWHITVALDGSDIRQFIGIVLKPKTLIHVLKMLLSRAPAVVPAETKPATPAPAAKPAPAPAAKPAAMPAAAKPETAATPKT